MPPTTSPTPARSSPWPTTWACPRTSGTATCTTGRRDSRSSSTGTAARPSWSCAAARRPTPSCSWSTPTGCHASRSRACAEARPGAYGMRLRSAEHPERSEEAGLRVVDALEGVVVEDDAADAAVLGEGAGLRLDLLRGEHAGDGREVGVAVHQLEVAGQLLDAVDLAAALDLDRDARAGR